MTDTKKRPPAKKGALPNNAHDQGRSGVRALTTSHTVTCPTCAAGPEAIVWRANRSTEFAHALPGNHAPWCAHCDRPWFRWSADPRLWRGAVA